MPKVKITGATIPYQLRPHKAVERNIFFDLLKRLSLSPLLKFQDYRYIGFGAAYLEDFKQMHLEIGVSKMDCIEMDDNAYTRQLFNKPYNFISPFHKTSTEYIDDDFPIEGNHILWFDYARPHDLRQQLTDIELLCAKSKSLDVIKFTFNAWLKAFLSSHGQGKRIGLVERKWTTPAIAINWV